MDHVVWGRARDCTTLYKDRKCGASAEWAKSCSPETTHTVDNRRRPTTTAASCGARQWRPWRRVTGRRVCESFGSGPRPRGSSGAAVPRQRGTAAECPRSCASATSPPPLHWRPQPPGGAPLHSSWTTTPCARGLPCSQRGQLGFTKRTAAWPR